MDKKELSELIISSYNKLGIEATVKLSDDIKELGFFYATKSGLTVAATDMIVPKEKEKIIEEASEVIKKINNQYWKGFMTDDERYTNTIQVWTNAKSRVAESTMRALKEGNDLFYMVDSGARGNWGQITQLCGMKGLVANPAGRTIELRFQQSKRRIHCIGYFIATHGGRKEKSDTALKTAEAGYLTRRLVDAVQDIVVKENDCKQ